MADKSTLLPIPPHNPALPYSRPPTPQPHPLQIGFYGLGSMGYLMARNLANHIPSGLATSLPLLVFNRTPAKCEKLVAELGGEAKGRVRIAQSAQQLAVECDVIITNLANDAVVKSVYEEFARVLTVRISFFFWALLVAMACRF